MPALLVIVVIPASALAYRPFVSTDAAVADEKQIEIELGYFNLDRNGELNTITTPSVVLNYGFAKDWEAVGEFQVEQSPDSEVADSGLFVKRVVKEGVLQDKPGVSLAVETGLLLPSTRFRERGVGFEAVGIVSGKVKTFTLHANAGGGLNRDDRHAFGIWGIIGELPLHPRVRLVGEVNGENAQGEQPNNSVLVGFIWQPTARNLFLDVGARHGIGRGAPDWQFTLGLTVGFETPSRQ